jgi:hypothetical protein
MFRPIEKFLDTTNAESYPANNDNEPLSDTQALHSPISNDAVPDEFYSAINCPRKPMGKRPDSVMSNPDHGPQERRPQSILIDHLDLGGALRFRNREKPYISIRDHLNNKRQ